MFRSTYKAQYIMYFYITIITFNISNNFGQNCYIKYIRSLKEVISWNQMIISVYKYRSHNMLPSGVGATDLWLHVACCAPYEGHHSKPHIAQAHHHILHSRIQQYHPHSCHMSSLLHVLLPSVNTLRLFKQTSEIYIFLQSGTELGHKIDL